MAKQYPYKDVKPVVLPNKQVVKKTVSKNTAKYLIVSEENNSYVTNTDDLSTIHTV